MPRPLGSETFTVLRAPQVVDSRDGSIYRDWLNATSTVVTQAMVQPFPMAEKLNFEFNLDREYARTAIRVYAPPGTDIEPTDRIEYKGATYEVFGHQGRWHRFSGVAHHVQVIARRMEG